MIRREDFVEILNEVREVNDYQEGLNQYFHDHGADGYLYQPDCICSTIKLLHLIFGQKDGAEWISRFCFELDFGRKWKPGSCQNDDGQEIPLSTPEELYDYLISNPE